MPTLPLLAAILFAPPPKLSPGDHTRTLTVDGRERSYVIHVPKKYDPKKPTPVVLILHGAGTNAAIMARFCGMNEKSDEAGFLAVYANGTGVGIFLTFNCGGLATRIADRWPDDVKYVDKLLDDLETVANVDKKRVYATGLSNGGMMCYRLAAELSHRIAAIAPVAGTLCIDKPMPKRCVPVIHFHGTNDRIVPYKGPDNGTKKVLAFKSVDETIETWRKLNKCAEKPVETKLGKKIDDGTEIVQKCYRSKDGGADVVLIAIKGAGHTWPGRPPRVSFIGKSTKRISANDMIWEFFQRHRLK
jgi:polyhydroxybutyrate depolymerase